MEDDGGQYFVSPVDQEIKCAMRKVVLHFEKAYKIKATKIHVRKFKKSIALWLANMTSKDNKDFSYELSNRNGNINILWEFIKWLMFLSNHTLIALLTATFERFGIKHGSEQYTKLIQESKDLYQEFKVGYIDVVNGVFKNHIGIEKNLFCVYISTYNESTPITC